MQTPHPLTPDKLDTATARRLAVAADCDPRTLRRVLAGVPVRGHVAERARAVLRAAGYSPEAMERQRAARGA